jgi:hypothetical protein
MKFIFRCVSDWYYLLALSSAMGVADILATLLTLRFSNFEGARGYAYLALFIVLFPILFGLLCVQKKQVQQSALQGKSTIPAFIFCFSVYFIIIFTLGILRL